MSKYKPKALPTTGLEPPDGAAPEVRTRAQVMREWEEQQSAAGAAPEAEAAAETQPVAAEQTVATVEPSVPEQKSVAAPTAAPVTAPVAPAAVLPDPDAEPAEQLAVCERGIHGAKARWKTDVDAATERFVDEAGPYLAWVHQHKLYKLIKDNSGKVYRSFPKYLREQHDLSERTGYRITQTIPLLRILNAGGHAVPDLSARQIAALHPVRIKHGDDAVLRVWNTASATMKGALPTPEELEKAKQLLELVTPPDADEEPRALTTATDPGVVVQRAAKLLVPETVREAVRKDPEQVRNLVRVLNAALDEVGVPVD
ncbi:hypothetical protein ACFVJK_48365 [Streptomyces sp. NPDC127172]|uniref:hypothetical protein n=1 Tax=Streptomyces sp. NPDC127172 TaxID=3345382 RepID=UPI00363CA8CD